MAKIKVHGRAGGCLRSHGPAVWEAGTTYCMKRDTVHLFQVTRDPALVTCEQCRAKYPTKHPAWD